MAVATGKVDGMVYAGGLFVGMFLYGETSTFFESFVNSTEMGQLTIPEYFNLPYIAVVIAVIAIALGGFYGAGLLEKKFNSR
ncbi:MAG: hypothetical protein ACYC7L_17120 [Nitrospirota bacterium]